MEILSKIIHENRFVGDNQNHSSQMSVCQQSFATNNLMDAEIFLGMCGNHASNKAQNITAKGLRCSYKYSCSISTDALSDTSIGNVSSSLPYNSTLDA